VSPLKYFLARAVYDWTLDNALTPHVIADATMAGVQVPPGYVENGRIVLNIHPRAIHGFSFDHGGIRFSARFGGSPYVIDIPLAGLLAIYAKENGQGVSFPERDEPPPAEPAAPGRPAPAPRKGPVLKRVK